MKQFISTAASVNIGKLRENNEDNLYFNGVFLTELTRDQPADFESICSDIRQFYAVCDGMGGEQFGELASLLSVETIHRYASLSQSDTGEGMDSLISRCINEANDAVCEAQRSRNSKRIGATLALLAIEGKTAYIYNVGDSRVYLLRDSNLRQISEDHTSVAHSVKMGLVTPEEAKKHPHRNRLTQFMGIDPAEMVIVPYKCTVKMRKRDIFLLCSDGLSEMVDESVIRQILLETSRPAEAARQLIDSALYNGGKDNVTVIVLSYGR